MEHQIASLDELISQHKALVATLGRAELKIELCRRGRLTVRRVEPWHRIAVTDVFCKLATQLGPRVALDLPIASPEFGVLVPDIVWMSDERWPGEDIDGAEPLTVVPDVCVEVLACWETDSFLLADRVSDYLSGGVKEIIVVEEDGTVRFWGHGGEQVRSAFNIALKLDNLSFRRQCVS
ncbi:Uma2 family endonuclease [Caballeronia sp. RCC_10]|jgi:hypothetical protein|uniref:Uma2 family endonuclease n=1 Tax=Caballeronia sp. RCC_10 TaxID=3239227 RepID=UPI0035239056